jgi:hypothetical protein
MQYTNLGHLSILFKYVQVFVRPVPLSTTKVVTLHYIRHHKYTYVDWYYNSIKFIMINTLNLIKLFFIFYQKNTNNTFFHKYCFHLIL